MPVTSSVESINPAKAKALIGNQVNNRAVVKSHVEWLASLMDRGEFVVSQPITLDESGRLIDGQHRMLAVIHSGKTISMLVVRGVKSETFAVMDTGRVRKGADVLSIKGRAQTNLLASALRLVWQDELGVLGSRAAEHRPSNADILDRDAEHPEIGNEVIQAVSQGKYAKCAPIVFLYWRTHRANKLVAQAFWPSVITGEGLRKGTPQYLLHNLLIQQRTGTRRMVGYEILAYAIKAWNYALLDEGDCPAALRWAAGAEAYPTICSTRSESEKALKNAVRARRALVGVAS